VRAAAFVLLVSAVTLLGPSGCAPGANAELKGVVEEAILPGMDASSCEWGSSTYPSEPKSWYGCWDYVRGDAAHVGKKVRSRLRSQGFDVSTGRTELTVELTAVRGSQTVCVDVLAPGFVDGRNTSPEEIDLDRGEVFVDVWMVEPRDGRAGGCAALPAWEA
jgi:hypothetical protein